MKKNILLYSLLILFFSAKAQDFNGQWKGEFTDKSTAFVGWGGDRCEYVLELECKGNNVSGYSYTYFSDAGKKYYTICKLIGTIDRKQKYIEVRETERTKTNVPANIRNCFQVHKLTYFKKPDAITIEGSWEPAPDQNGDCGFGTTVLTRRELKQSYPKFNVNATKGTNHNKPKAGPDMASSKIVKKSGTQIAKQSIAKKNNPVKSKIVNPVKPSLAEKKEELVRQEIPLELQQSPHPNKEAIEKIMVSPRFEKRNNTVLKTIEVNNKVVKVDLYDNGEVDGDSISLFYNGKLLLSNKRLSEKSISLNITVEDDMLNELVMYAENLGTIPPNTALMVVTDGSKRYEVRITSDLQKSGVINFVHKSGLADN